MKNIALLESTYNGVILKWDGSKWLRITTPDKTAFVSGKFHVVSENDIYAIITRGSQNKFAHWDGSKWNDISSGFSYTQDIQYLSGAIYTTGHEDPSGIMLPAQNGPYTVKCDGIKWVMVTQPYTQYYGIVFFYAISEQDIYAVYYDAGLMHWNGNNWELMSNTAPVRGIKYFNNKVYGLNSAIMQFSPFYLSSSNPIGNNNWGVRNVYLPKEYVAPGEYITFNFQITAPATPGDYSFEWVMIDDKGQPFGEPTERKFIAVTS